MRRLRVHRTRPAGIVLAEDAGDVAAAVRLAKERGLQVSVRAGGHSMSAAGIREDALLVDVSPLASIDIDAQARTAVVGPGVHGKDLELALDPLGCGAAISGETGTSDE